MVRQITQNLISSMAAKVDHFTPASQMKALGQKFEIAD